MKKIRPFRLSDETVNKLDALCDGNRTEWIERVIEAGGNLDGVVLAEKPKARLKELSGKMGLSEVAVLEMAIMEFNQKATMTVTHGFAPNSQPMGRLVDAPLPERPTTLEGKRAAALAALAGRKDPLRILMDGGPNLTKEIGRRYLESQSDDLAETPHAPFDFEQEGETYRVRGERNGLGLYWLGEDGEQRKRSLVPGELETMWLKRIIK